MGLIFTVVIVGAASRYGRAAGLAAAIAGFLCWNFFFLTPIYTFSVSDPRDVVALAVFLITGIVTGSLAGRVRIEAENASARIEALRRISLFGQRFSRAATQAEILHDTAAEAAAMTTGGVVLLARKADSRSVPIAEPPANTILDDAALAAADWSFRNDIETGIGTATLALRPLGGSSRCGSMASPIGILGAPDPTVAPLGAAQPDFGRTWPTNPPWRWSGCVSPSVPRRPRRKEDSQKLRTALLSSLSHDLRTPLTAIRGAAETLAAIRRRRWMPRPARTCWPASPRIPGG